MCHPSLCLDVQVKMHYKLTPAGVTYANSWSTKQLQAMAIPGAIMPKPIHKAMRKPMFNPCPSSSLGVAPQDASAGNANLKPLSKFANKPAASNVIASNKHTVKAAAKPVNAAVDKAQQPKTKVNRGAGRPMWVIVPAEMLPLTGYEPWQFPKREAQSLQAAIRKVCS